MIFFSLSISYSPYLLAVMMDEPRFAQPIPNVTVAVGRDANLYYHKPMLFNHVSYFFLFI